LISNPDSVIRRQQVRGACHPGNSAAEWRINRRECLPFRQAMVAILRSSYAF
jgi:hypothetical protein